MDTTRENTADMNTDIMTTDSNSTKSGVNVADTRENAADIMADTEVVVTNTNITDMNTDVADTTDMSIVVREDVMTITVAVDTMAAAMVVLVMAPVVVMVEVTKLEGLKGKGLKKGIKRVKCFDSRIIQILFRGHLKRILLL